MILLADTHVLVWSQSAPRKLSKAAASAITRARKRNELAISAFSLYELATYLEREEISLARTIEETLHRLTDGILIRPLTLEIASLATQFPMDFPRDPGDRIIAATARAEDCPLVTADERIQRSKLIKTIW